MNPETICSSKRTKTMMSSTTCQSSFPNRSGGGTAIASFTQMPPTIWSSPREVVIDTSSSNQPNARSETGSRTRRTTDFRKVEKVDLIQIIDAALAVIKDNDDSLPLHEQKYK